MAAQILMALASAGIPLAQNYLSSRRQDKYNKNVAEGQRHANLVNALSRGRLNSNVVAEMPKAGLLERGLGAAQMGLQGYNAYQSLAQAKSLFDQQSAANKQNLEIGKQNQALNTQNLASGAMDIRARQANQVSQSGELAGLGGTTAQTPLQATVESYNQRSSPNGVRTTTPEATAPRSFLEGLSRGNQQRDLNQSQINLNQARSLGALALPGPSAGALKQRMDAIKAQAANYASLNPFTTPEAYIAQSGIEDPQMQALAQRAFMEQADTKRKFVATAMDKAITDSQKANATIAIGAFNLKMQTAGVAVPPSVFEEILNSAEKQVDIGPENTRIVAQVLSVDNAIMSIIPKIAKHQDKFGKIAGLQEKIMNYWNGGATDPDVAGLLVEIGLAADTVARIKTGAAMTEYESKTFMDDFSADLQTNPTAAISRLFKVQEHMMGFANGIPAVEFRQRGIEHNMFTTPEWALNVRKLRRQVLGQGQ